MCGLPLARELNAGGAGVPAPAPTSRAPGLGVGEARRGQVGQRAQPPPVRAQQLHRGERCVAVTRSSQAAAHQDH